MAFFKLFKTREEIEAINVAYAQAFKDFEDFINLQKQHTSTPGPLVVNQPANEETALLLGNLTATSLEEMKKNVEEAIAKSPNSTNLKEVMTRALNATKDFVEFSKEPEKTITENGKTKNLASVTEEFTSAQKAVTRLSVIKDTGTYMIAIGTSMMAIGAIASLSGAGAVFGLSFFVIGAALTLIGAIMESVSKHGHQLDDRDAIGNQMSTIQAQTTFTP